MADRTARTRTYTIHETLRCLHCDDTWERVRTGGHKPRLCPTCCETVRKCRQCEKVMPLDRFYGREASCCECIRGIKSNLRCAHCDQDYMRVKGDHTTKRINLCPACTTVVSYCTMCWLIKPVDQFDRAARRANGRRTSCKACHSEKYKASDHVPGRAAKFGLTAEDWIGMAESQSYRCAICRRTAEEVGYATRGKQGKSLVIDHCHATGAIRVLLCGPCNAGIGMLREDLAVLESAMKYLEKHSQTD